MVPVSMKSSVDADGCISESIEEGFDALEAPMLLRMPFECRLSTQCVQVVRRAVIVLEPLCIRLWYEFVDAASVEGGFPWS